MRKYLSVCAIVKNEEDYLPEWIAFHQYHGVDHFFIYENESTDNTWEVLKRYEAIGVATIEKVEGNSKQLATYNKCLDDHGKESQWIAFLDTDEFLYSQRGSLSLLLESYENYSAVAVNWILFGSNGHKTKEPGLVIERFTKRAKETDRHVKTILQPHLTIGTGNNAHYFKLESPAVNEYKELLPEEYYHTKPTSDIFRINHYHTKSKEEYIIRKSYIDVDGVNRGTVEDRFKGHDVNEVTDLYAHNCALHVYTFMEDNLNKYLETVWESCEPKPWQVKEEFIQFLKFILDNNIKNILEIGTHKGGSASAFLKIGCKVTSIDIVKQPEIEKLEKNEKFKFLFREHLNGFVSKRSEGTFDLLFIDGGHQYFECITDFNEYKYFVKPGKFIAFHDVVDSELHKEQNCEVNRAIIEIMGLFEIKEKVDFITDGNWGGISIIKWQ